MDHLLQSGFSKEQLQDFEALIPPVSPPIPKPLGKPSSRANTASPQLANGHVVDRNGSKAPAWSDNGFQDSTQHSDMAASNGASVPNRDAYQHGVVPIAVIGMSCRLPGDASDPERFWDLCAEGRSAWSVVPAEKFNVDAFYHPDPERIGSMNVKAGHFLKDHDYSPFDASFFNISPNEAKAMDPRQRMHLEGAYEALEHAGITLAQVAETNTSVYVGAFNGDYGEIIGRDQDQSPFYKAVGLGASLFANRISYFMNLRGPSIVVDTACSASLTAIHLACEGLRYGESKMSIVSGANLILTPDTMTMLSTLRFLSPDGRTYMFDQRANGYSRGEGIGTLILKPLHDALHDGNTIHAVIRNTASNQDGRTAGITVPNQQAQESLILSAYAEAGIDPAETDFFEAHGTGTQAGDVIEAGAISTAFCSSARPSSRPLYVGSIKTQIGHCEGASGVAGMLHAILSVKHGYILPNCNFEFPNEKIPLKEWRLKVPTKLEPWSVTNTRRASVNSFGYGGTNVHAIVEEPPRQPRSCRAANGNANGHANGNANGSHTNGQSHTQDPKVLCLSAHDENGVQRIAHNLATYLESHKDKFDDNLLNDLVFTLGEHRSTLQWRVAYPVCSVQEIIELANTQLKPSRVTRALNVAFVFTGQGAQWAGMGRELLDFDPVFRNTLESAENHLIRLGGSWSLIDELCRDANTSRINEAYLSQPLCTAVQIALVRLLKSWAILPKSVVGHSSGEIAAAYCAGNLTLESAMTVAYYRGKYSSQLKQKAPELQGGMLAVGLSADECEKYISSVKSGKLNISCVNSPVSTTVSGDLSAIHDLQSKLKASDVFNRMLKVDIAYHSHHMKILAEEYLHSLSTIGSTAPNGEIAFFSSVFPGVPVGSSPEYWVENMLRPVRFTDAVRNMSSRADPTVAEIDLLVEIGPHSALAGPLKQIYQLPAYSNFKPTYFSGLQRDSNAVQSVLDLACNLYSKGLSIDFGRINFPSGSLDSRILTDLPPYPWNHTTKHWHEGRLSRNYRHRQFPRHDILGTLSDDSTELELKWKNFIRLSELPWLRHHMVRGDLIYPGSGYVAMAVEATRQKKALLNQSLQGYTLREVSFSKALVVPDTTDGIEVSLALRPYRQGSLSLSGTWDEFSVYSHSSDRGATIHCQGLIGTQSNFTTDAMEVQKTIAEAKGYCTTTLDLDKVWKKMSSTGVELGPCFSNVSSCITGRNQALCTLAIADTAALMPYQFEHPSVISAASLDGFFQCSIIASAEGVLDFTAPIIPTYLKEIVISKEIKNHAGQRFSAYASIKKLGARLLDGNVIAVDNLEGSSEPMIQINGLRFSVLAKEEFSRVEDASNKLCWNLLWKYDIDDLTRTDIDGLWPVPEIKAAEIDSVAEIERVTWHCVQKAIESLTEDDYAKMEPFHRAYCNWLRKKYELGKAGNLPYQTREWQTASDHDIDGLNERVAAKSAHGRMTVRIGENLIDILQKKVEALSVMLQDNLLNEFYESISGQDRVYLQAARYMDLLAHKNPNLKILEVGAGTGSVTRFLLDVLGGANGKYPRFSEYCFTDISPGFFEKAQEKFRDWTGHLQFKKLNIEENLEAQGFPEEKYDVIVAANVLHATHKMDHTMTNVGKLLKPGGKLVLVEVTGADHALSGPFVFGTLPGWWTGVDEGRVDGPCLSEKDWDALLRRNKFSGLDACRRDSESDDAFSTSMMASTKTQKSLDEIHANIMILRDEFSGGPSIGALTSQFHAIQGKKPSVAQLEDGLDFKGIYVILDRAKGSFILEPNAKQFDALKKLVANAKGILWVTFGGVTESETPDAGAVIGFLRTMRTENYGTKIVMLNMDQHPSLPDEEAVKIISKVSCASFKNLKDTMTMSELEYQERRGYLLIPRIVEDKPANDFIISESQTQEPQLLPFSQENNPLRLTLGSPGLLDTFRFVSDTANEVDRPVDDDQVKIEVRASGLNFHDLMIAIGKLPDDSIYGLECAGIVSKVGVNVKNFKPGDRVCALSPAAFANYCLAPQSLTIHIPEDMTFEVAASIPSVFCTAQYSLVQAARLQKDESILIHSAAGGLGQASIQIAQLIGAQIFVTVGTPSKADFLAEKYGIPRTHILNSRDLSFAPQIMKLTKGKGVDVAINSLAGEGLRETWKCMAMFGRFVELGKLDILENSRLDMGPFEQCVSFITVGMDILAVHRMQAVQKALQDVFSQFRHGALIPIGPITTYPMSQVEQAFRLMATGKHMGKIVIKVDPDDQVQVIPKSSEHLLLREKSSFLIVGGLGGIGAALSEWFTHRLAAKHLILISRGGDDKPEAKKAVEALRQAGAEVAVFKCDVGDGDQVNQVISHCAEIMPPIRGVIHGGMVLRDSIFPNMSLEEYAGALRAKIPGSVNLHSYFTSNGHELDFFIMLSSLAGIMGNTSQANYAAGNTFQDALAHHRASHGLAATAIDLGNVLDVGWVAQNRAKVASEVLETAKDISLPDLKALIKHAIKTSMPVRSKTDVNATLSHQIMFGIEGFPSTDAKFSHVPSVFPKSSSSANSPSDQKQTSIRALVAQAPPNADVAMLADIIVTSVRQKLSRLLSLPENEIDEQDTLSGHGIDSLVAVEVRNWLRKDAGADVSIFEILSGKGTIRQLVEKIAEEKIAQRTEK